MRELQIFTDGGCDPNPGPGGWGYVILEEGEEEITGNGGHTNTTNNKMELTAVIEAINQLDEPARIKVFSDSKYVVNGLNSWLEKWVNNNFKAHQMSGGGDIKNRDLWEHLWDYKQTHDIKAYWIRGHSGIEHNEKADALAVQGRLKVLGIKYIPQKIRYNQIKAEYDIAIRKGGHSYKDYSRLIKYLQKGKWDFTVIS